MPTKLNNLSYLKDTRSYLRKNLTGAAGVMGSAKR